MDQTQEQLDPEVAKEVIALLNNKIAYLRNENAQLQVWPQVGCDGIVPMEHEVI